MEVQDMQASKRFYRSRWVCFILLTVLLFMFPVEGNNVV